VGESLTIQSIKELFKLHPPDFVFIEKRSKENGETVKLDKNLAGGFRWRFMYVNGRIILFKGGRCLI
jgi:hypothetical protein